MREIHASVISTIDGFFEDLDGTYSFAAEASSDESRRSARDLLMNYDCFVFGRKTYVAGERSWASEAARATRDPVLVAAMNTTNKILVSRTLTSGEWGETEVFGDDPIGSIRQLKARPGGNMLVIGSGSIRTALLEAGLLDRLKVSYLPVVLGAGRPLLEGLQGRVTARAARVACLAGGVVNVEYVFT